MTEAAGIRGTTPTASVLAQGALRGFPILMIRGVYRCGWSQVNFYSLPACPETSSKYRLRKAVRAALQGFVATVADWRQREVRS